MIKAIIFDFFGVVFGTGTWDLYELAGGDQIKDADFLEEVTQASSSGRITPDEFHKRIANNLGIPINEWKKLNADTGISNKELLEFVKSIKNDYKVAILSNAARGSVKGKLTDEETSIFDEVVVSGEVGLVKPDPAVFKYTAERLGVKPQECVFTDDHAKYLDGAKKAGLKTIRFINTNQFKQDLELMLDE